MDSANVATSRPIAIRRQLAAQLRHVIEGGGVPLDQALPSIPELAGFLGVDPDTVARVVADLKRGGYVEARRGKGLFVAHERPSGPSPDHDADLPTALPPTAVGGAVTVLLVECSPAGLDFFARELVAHLPVRVDKVLLGDLAVLLRRQQGAGRWAGAVTSFGHLEEVTRLLRRTGVHVIALLAEAHLETLHWLAQLASGTRVGVASAAAATAHNLEHSIANAGLPNIVLVGAGPAGGAALGRLVRQVDVIVCSTAAAERVRGLAGSAVRVMIDDRAVDQRAIDMLAALLGRPNRDRTAAAPRVARSRPSSSTRSTGDRVIVSRTVSPRSSRRTRPRAGTRATGGASDATSRPLIEEEEQS
jgi:GntR family transcriptional regulator